MRHLRLLEEYENTVEDPYFSFFTFELTLLFETTSRNISRAKLSALYTYTKDHQDRERNVCTLRKHQYSTITLKEFLK